MSVLHDAATAALRRFEPETAHRLSVRALAAGLGPRDGDLDDPALFVRMAGLDAPNCLGLAAGYDKDAEVPNALLRAGFGFVECGTVTPLPQVGSPRPRLFRLSRDRGVINRMGFNNCGLDLFGSRLQRRKRMGLVGANLGANKDSSDRIGDYVLGLERLWGLCDYFTINVSSPNTPGLRDLQSRASLEELGGRLAQARRALKVVGEPTTPVFLKVAPDLNDREVVDIVEAARAHAIDGLIVSNTTVSRPDGLRGAAAAQAGGLSGRPLFDLSTRMLRRFHEATPLGDLELIGAGGVGSGADAYAKIKAGASAVQLYSALVYKGPGLVRRIKRDLAQRLRADGFSSAGEARGVG